MARDTDKTEKPTPKRLKEARKKGQIPKTPELATWTQLLVATFVLEWTVSLGGRELGRLTYEVKSLIEQPDSGAALGLFGDGLWSAVVVVLPLMATMGFVGVATNVAQTKGNLATKAIQPSFAKLNPLAGIKKLFQPTGMWNGGKSAAKVAVLALVAWRPVWGIAESLLAHGRPSTETAVHAVATRALSLTRTVAAVGLLLAAADYGFQRWQVGKNLLMSKKDKKDEAKQQEGDPKVKAAIRRRMFEMTRNRMLAAIPDADVVIVNPTHVAVALKYTPGQGAPVVVAKGRGHVATRIREEAAKHFVPIVRDVGLARTLERACRVDQPIPPDLYEAVARLLAFVFQLGKRAATMGGVLRNPHEQPVDDATLALA